MSEDMPEQFHTLNVLRLIARPFTNGGSTPLARSVVGTAPQVEARGAAEPDHVSPYLLRPLRSEVECLLKRYREGGARG